MMFLLLARLDVCDIKKRHLAVCGEVSHMGLCVDVA